MNRKQQASRSNSAWHITLIISALLLLGGLAVKADIQEYEGFDYTGTALDTQDGGTGWSGGWTNLDGHAVLSDDGVSLPFPPSVGHTPVGGRVVFDTTAGGKAARRLGTGLPLTGEGTTFYCSALVNRGGEFRFEFSDNSGNVRWRFGGAGTGSTNAAVLGVANDQFVNNVFPIGETVFIVAKIVTHATANDQVYLNVYRLSDTVPISEPSTWQASGGSASGVALTWLQLRNVSGASSEVDEIRIGTSWLEVAGAVAAGPPVVITHPVGVSVYEGLSAQFTVEATGALPLTYQWQREGEDVPNATNATLVLSNLETSQGGYYAAVVMNSVGTNTSNPALLTVIPITSLDVGLQALWHFDESSGDLAADAIGTNVGVLHGFTGNQWVPTDYTRGLKFSGSNYVEVAHSASIGPALVNRFSISAWLMSRVNISTNGNQYRTMEKENTFFLLQGDGNTNNLGIGGMNLLVKKAGVNISASIGEALLANQWYHIGATFDGSAIRVYLNGQLKDTRAVSAPIDSTTLPLHIGADYATSGQKYFDGVMDEVGLWDRPLSATEVLELSGQTGIPVILQQPQSVGRYAGSTVTLQVRARGQQPLRYLWYKGDTEIRTATSPILTIGNIQPEQAGDYRCLVSNDAGETYSDIATVTVIPITSINDGMQAMWKFDETTGLTASDSSGQGYDGALTDYAGDDSQWTAGQVNGALQFDGQSNRVLAANSGGLNVGADATFAFWIHPSNYGTGGYGTGYGYHTSRVLRKGSYIDIEVVDDPGTVRATLRVNGIPAPQQNILPLNQWTHFAISFSGGMMTFYKNGFRLGDPVPGNLGAPNTSSVVLGNSTDTMSATNLFAGAMDEVGIWARVLGETEILNLAGQDIAGPPVIVAQPESATRYAGGTVSFFVNATGLRPLTYEWQHNDTPIPNSNTNLLVLANLITADAGNYTVSVANSQGSTVSTPPAVLSIREITNVTTGLIAYWKFDETDGTVFHDSSGNGHDAVLQNGTIPSVTPGIIGGAFNFDGVGAFAIVPNAPDLTLDGQVTISVWVNPATLRFTGDHGRILRKDINYDLNLDSTRNAFIVYGKNKEIYAAPNNSVTSNEWQHFVVVVKDGTVQFFKNGVATGNPMPGALGPGVTNDLIIGNFGSDLSIERLFKGGMDDLGLWERALTPSEIDGIYQNGLVGRALNEPFVPFKLETVSFPTPAQVRLTFHSPYTGRQYVVEKKEQINAASWVPETAATINDLGSGLFEALFDKSAETAFYRVTVAAQADLFYDGFETFGPGWTHGGQGDNWEVGTPVNGPTAAFAGTNVFATSLTGNILPFSDNYLRSPTIDLTGISRATLAFEQWRNVDPDPTFHATIVNVLDANTLSVIQQLSLESGATSGWELRTLPLPTTALGKRIILEFRLYCDNYNLVEGWYIDEVKLLRE